MRSTAASVDAREGTLFARRYRLVRRIGASALGDRYEARDERGAAWALKILAPALVPAETFSRTIADASIVSTISGSPVVPVVDSGEDDETGERFVATPLLPGRSLASVLESTGALPPTTALIVALDVASALTALHERGLVHRNVRAETVFLEDVEGGVLRVRLTDMGFVPRIPAVSTSMTASDADVVSRVAPELVFRTGIDERTDVFGAGALLYEMLTGEPPWGRDVERLTTALMGRRVPEVQRLAPWVGPQLAQIVQRATMRDAGARFRHAGELAARLRALALPDRSLTPAMFRKLAPEERGVVAALAVEQQVDPLAETIDSEYKDPLVGRELAGGYRVIGLVGRGGMGAVYECRTKAGEKVAAKLIARDIASGDHALVARFLREARAATQITSPHVTRVIELGTDETTRVPFIVMELLEGRDLSAMYQERGALAGVPLARVFAQAARGLAAAHAGGVVHRDVKPGNVFLHVGDTADPDSEPVLVKLCDFGVAKAARAINERTLDKNTNLTASGRMLGTPMYMSPEQARNAKDVDARSDVWSLCATLFEGLAGRGLWVGGRTMSDVLVAVANKPAPSLREVAPWVDPQLAAIVARGLAADPAARWQDANALADALEAFAGGTTVTMDELVAADVKASATAAPAAQVSTDTPPPTSASPSSRSAWQALVDWLSGGGKR